MNERSNNMAHIETWYRCACGASYETRANALKCAVSHVQPERWAVGSTGKAVRIYDNWAPKSAHGVNGALIEAELSDDIKVRKQQIAEMEEKWECEKKKGQILHRFSSGQRS